MSLPSWCPQYDGRKHDPKTGEDLYCICKKPDSGELMVGCDGCDDWFHFSCLKIPENYRDLVFSFYCSYCTAGITGPALTNGGKLPKTLWKRKCRLRDCYRECDSASNSKYCSKKHGLQYVQDVVERLQLPNVDKIGLLRQLLTETASLEEFKKLGRDKLPEVSLPLSIERYNNLIENDRQLKNLTKERDELVSNKLLKLAAEEGEIGKYICWVNEVNDKLLPQLAQPAARKKSKTSTKVTICGYHDEFAIPCAVEVFLDELIELKEEEDSICSSVKSICVKTKCAKHQDWIQLAQNEIAEQKEALENVKKRLDLLINVRTNQLRVSFFEQ
ncbi:unnamed protein product [Kluyveromyces dobzhanskii CBS 2104]|uniref:WGS project CCBQ000000000 data, contig 00104 n=1 Tax=Kluyveromyces dobzhanskii CBS 2104 TaxID=1427455 RepID=A0A0A8L5X5_9SACH|nr:unnamed protein product [Kluyveromyces dobzhanskii CBS 2104]